MIRLLLVDDERHILAWLYALFSRLEDAKLDLYKASHAQEALTILEHTRIDIVLTDIRMPGMSGLEMLDVIHRQYPLCRVIFLTGYSSFDDIYRATRHDRVQFLTKTEDDEAIVAAVLQAVREIRQERERTDRNRLHQSMLSLLSQRELLLRLLSGDLAKEEYTAQTFARYQVSLQPISPALLLLGRLRPPKDDPQAWLPAQRSHALSHISLLFQQRLGEALRLCQADYRPHKIAWLLQANSALPGENSLRKALEDIAAACLAQTGAGLSFLVCAKEQPLPLIPALFMAMEETADYLLGEEAGLVLYYAGKTQAPPGTMPQDIRQALLSVSSLHSALTQGDLVAFDRTLSSIIRLLSAQGDLQNLHAIELYTATANVLVHILNRAPKPHLPTAWAGVRRLLNPESFASWSEAGQYLQTLSRAIHDIHLHNQHQQEHSLLQEISAFVQKNLAGDLSLSRIGEQLGYNPSYLSRMFKQITGENLSRYILTQRLEYARLRLGQDGHSIGRIARDCGFDSAQYFATAFRKAYGLSPQDFRARGKG